MATAALTRYTPEEYLALERHAEFRSEYLDGRIVAMTGAQRAHNLIVHNLDREIGTRLFHSPCEVYPGDMKVAVGESRRYVYPDLAVTCDPRFADNHADVLLTPLVIVEVLSDSTEAYDRGEKFFHYRRIASLQEYVLLSQDECMVEHYVREGDFWRYTALDDADSALGLSSIGVELPLRLIYHKVPGPARDAAAGPGQSTHE